jgi:hypothetical protein
MRRRYLGEVFAGQRLLGTRKHFRPCRWTQPLRASKVRSAGTGTPDPGGWAGASEISVRVRFLSAGEIWLMLHDEAFGQWV